MGVPGLRYLENFVTEAEAVALLSAVDAEPWLDALKRRVQHYGYRYDYKRRFVDRSQRLGPLPTWSESVVGRLLRDGVMARPDQLIVNEYTPGQGITAHVDCVPCFGPAVASLTLGSGCVMEFADAKSDATESVWLRPRSLVVLADDARYRWTHAIPGRKSDRVNEMVRARGRRVSLTFRTVILGEG